MLLEKLFVLKCGAVKKCNSEKKLFTIKNAYKNLTNKIYDSFTSELWYYHCIISVAKT